MNQYFKNLSYTIVNINKHESYQQSSRALNFIYSIKGSGDQKP